MTLRQLQLTGHTTGANVIVLFNQATIFEGTLPSTGSVDQVEALVQWEQELDLIQESSSQIEVRCIAGSLHCVDILINELSNRLLRSDLTWPLVQPTRSELICDLALMNNDDELVGKYGLSREQLSGCFELVDTLTSTGNFRQAHDISVNQILCKIDGVVETPLREDGQQGVWHWFLESGQNLTFDLVLLRDDPIYTINLA